MSHTLYHIFQQYMTQHEQTYDDVELIDVLQYANKFVYDKCYGPEFRMRATEATTTATEFTLLMTQLLFVEVHNSTLRFQDLIDQLSDRLMVAYASESVVALITLIGQLLTDVTSRFVETQDLGNQQVGTCLLVTVWQSTGKFGVMPYERRRCSWDNDVLTLLPHDAIAVGSGHMVTASTYLAEDMTMYPELNSINVGNIELPAGPLRVLVDSNDEVQYIENVVYVKAAFDDAVFGHINTWVGIPLTVNGHPVIIRVTTLGISISAIR